MHVRYGTWDISHRIFDNQVMADRQKHQIAYHMCGTLIDPSFQQASYCNFNSKCCMKFSGRMTCQCVLNDGPPYCNEIWLILMLPQNKLLISILGLQEDDNKERFLELGWENVSQQPRFRAYSLVIQITYPSSPIMCLELHMATI